MSECSDVALITGAAGFVGRHLARRLAADGARVVGLDRPGAPRPEDWPGQWLTVDITDGTDLTYSLRSVAPSHVYHLAALIHSQDLEALMKVNLKGTQNVFDAMLALGHRPRILVAGSASEYGLVSNGNTPIGEATPLQPLSLYGLSKAAQGMLSAQYFIRTGLDIVRVRTFNLSGPGEPDTLVCSAFAKRLAEIKIGAIPPSLKVGSLEAVRDFLDVRDAVKAYAAAASRGTPGRVYNVASGMPTQVAHVLTTLLDISGLTVTVEEEQRLKTAWDVPVQVGDATALRRETDWGPEISFSQSMGDLWRYWCDVHCIEESR